MKQRSKTIDLFHNLIDLKPKLFNLIKCTLKVWNNIESNVIIIRSPGDSGTWLMCLTINDSFVCPIAFSNEHTSWAFVLVKRLKGIPSGRFKCDECVEEIDEKTLKCFHCKRYFEEFIQFEYFGSLQYQWRSKIVDPKESIESKESMESIYEIDPMLYRQQNQPWQNRSVVVVDS